MSIQGSFRRHVLRIWSSVHAGYGRFGHSLYLLYIEFIKKGYIGVIIIYRSTTCLPSAPSVLIRTSFFPSSHVWHLFVCFVSFVVSLPFPVSGFSHAMP